MKTMCLILFLGLSMPGCSMFSKGDGQSRAYRKYLKKMKVSRDHQRNQIRQRAEMPSLRNQQPSPPQESVQVSESQ
jgi:hypothetical protein